MCRGEQEQSAMRECVSFFPSFFLWGGANGAYIGMGCHVVNLKKMYTY